MSIKEKDLKLLWSRSGNRCAICRTELSQSKDSQFASYTLGEQAHIVGEKPEAPRGKSLLIEEERNSYHNLILLCPNHHTEIDKDEGNWLVEKLHIIKSKHELWVSETLSNTANLKLVAQQLAITSIIDAAVELCQLENWKTWASRALAPDPQWRSELLSTLFVFRQHVAAAIWPEDFGELKRAAITLAILSHNASRVFTRYCEPTSDGYYRSHKFYRAGGFNPNYREDLEKYTEWLHECWHFVIEATKAVNWFADVVRRDVNPTFFVERGRFTVVEGPFTGDLSLRASIPEFTEEEKNNLPDSLQDI